MRECGLTDMQKQGRGERVSDPSDRVLCQESLQVVKISDSHIPFFLQRILKKTLFPFLSGVTWFRHSICSYSYPGWRGKKAERNKLPIHGSGTSGAIWGFSHRETARPGNVCLRIVKPTTLADRPA